MNRDAFYWFLCAAVVLTINGCTTITTTQPSAAAIRAAQLGMTRNVILGTSFHHVIYTHGDWTTTVQRHIYLEGDGLPWINRNRIAADPTARYPLALHLMAQDPHPALYIGRPCYEGLSQTSGCHPWFWTHGRYSPAVVTSLVRALEQVLSQHSERRLTLIGYSGGGVLAVLIAKELTGVDSVITIAANLDIDAWTDQHGYSRLIGSINPAQLAPLNPKIRQLHLFGARDTNVTPQLVRRFMAHHPQAIQKSIPQFDHRCCWVEHWPTLLESAP